MIKVYTNGIDFYEENKTILLTNEYTEPFFRLDYPLLTKAGKDEYAIRVQEGNACLLALCVEPYSILLHGDKSLASELVLFLTSNGYRIKDYLCSIELGQAMIPLFQSKGFDFHLSLGMDFMEADRKTSEPLNAVVHPTADDVDQLFEMTCNFIKDCGLTDIAKKERILENLENYRILKIDGKIASMIKIQEWTDRATKISMVYTRNEYRNQGCARAIVSYALNEIVDSKKVATLNVDQKNPISYHLYSSMGFRKIFSQGVFSPISAENVKN